MASKKFHKNYDWHSVHEEFQSCFFFVLKDLGGNAEKDFGRDPSGLQSIRLR